MLKKQTLIYFIGLLIMALGSSLTIKANIGTSSFDALCVGLSKSIGLSIGNWCIILGIFLIFINSILLKEKPSIYSFLTSLLAGFMIDFWLNFLIIDSKVIFFKIFIFLVGITINALGISIYIQSGLAKGAIDNFMLAIKKVTKSNLMISKFITEFLFIALSIIVKGSIGIGTIVIAILSGLLIETFHNKTKPLILLVLKK